MDFLSNLSSKLDQFADRLDALAGNADLPSTQANDGFDVMQKDYCWEDLDYAGEFTLQRHVVHSEEFRIVDKHGSVVERGTQAALEASMVRRSAQAAAIAAAMGNPTATNASTIPGSVQAQYGDIIGVVRRNGAYTHYGIYVSDTCVVHYAIPASKTIGHATVHTTSLRYFLRDDSDYFILDFPKPYQPPVAIGSETPPHIDSISEGLAHRLQQHYGYHLYTPEETVQRARSRLGETRYNLLTNNCDHFAIWCKTGVSESVQISGMLESLRNTSGFQFHRPFRPW